jgi:RNA polymerase sigma factor (sigma-70 family)
MSEDLELLRAYAERRSEPAFAELVRRHIGLVYSVALRQVGGNVHLAEDVTQQVFTDLAKKARAVSAHPVLSGWLYRSTQFEAIDLLRAESRRRAREKEAQTMHEIFSPSVAPADLEKIRPFLDHAMGDLNERDRDAIMLRFFENRPFAEIGHRLRLTEDAARMRVERALEKMRGLLTRRGVTSTSAALAAALAGQASAAPPALLAASVTSAAMNAAAGTSTGVLTVLGALSLMKTSSLILTGSLVANAIFAAMAISRPSRELNLSGFSRPTTATLPTLSLSAKIELTDAVEIGRRLKAAGFSNEVIKWAVRTAVAERFGDENRQAEAERQARVRRWNPEPDRSSRAVAPGLVAPERTRPGGLQMEYTQAAWAELGLDSSGNPVQSQYRNLSPAKATLVSKIEEDYRAIREKGTLRVGSSASLSRETANRIADEFETDIRAALSPSEAGDYFRHNGEASRQVQAVVGDLKITDESFAAIADAAVAVERENRAPGKAEAAGAMANLLATYRRELGDEQFLALAGRLPCGNIYQPLDPIYRSAEFPIAARADLLAAMVSSMATLAQADRAQWPSLAAQIRAAFTTDRKLTRDQIAAFDASPAGELLQRLANPPQSGEARP